eukprot:TRINITY_DN87224_c0_g1_i1.p1 TRINITY_DN87224_c0_g1~~TRINITY_DN87224_c0_g1_i1.p1  ORF type:complete len:264 (-),score=25.16 TRINITY_DN87224_c0_g1_i1:464-1255(-)
MSCSGANVGDDSQRSCAQVQLKVVGLGWPRTGTGSLCDALEVLGLGPCYHFRNLLRFEQNWSFWDLAFAESNRTRRAELVLVALQGYASAADVPTACFWDELLHAQEIGLLPASVRFVLPTKSAEDWYDSAESTVLGGWKSPKPSSYGQGSRAIVSNHTRRMSDVWYRLFGHERLQLPQDRGIALAAYQSHQEDVNRRAVPESLIHWAPAQGWTGLCRPLGLPEPKVAFPWRHQRDKGVSDLLAGRSFLSLIAAQPIQASMFF